MSKKKKSKREDNLLLRNQNVDIHAISKLEITLI
jgi:hypothetical protein